jgi:hypothetical protein
MKVQEIADRLGLEALTPVFDREVLGIFISDMVSDVMANAKAGDLLVTVQVHANAIAAANLVDLCGIILARGSHPSDDVLTKAVDAQIPIFSTPRSHWQVAVKLYEIGLR